MKPAYGLVLLPHVHTFCLLVSFLYVLLWLQQVGMSTKTNSLWLVKAHIGALAAYVHVPMSSKMETFPQISTGSLSHGPKTKRACFLCLHCTYLHAMETDRVWDCACFTSSAKADTGDEMVLLFRFTIKEYRLFLYCMWYHFEMLLDFDDTFDFSTGSWQH